MSLQARIGVIGVGYIGETHVKAFQSVDEARVVAISDVNSGRLAEIKDRYAIKAAYLDVGDMLRKARLDGVVIATPDHLHRAPVQAAAEAGLPILLEKPIATTLRDAEGIISAVERAGVKAVQAFVLRFELPYVTLRQGFASGAFGIPHTAYAARILNISQARRYNGRCSVNQYLACHDFDYLLWVMGTDVESIYATRSDFRACEETGEADSYWNLIRWKNGAAASVLTSWGLPENSPRGHWECRIIGTKGCGEVAGSRLRIFTDEMTDSIEDDPDADAYRDQAQAFVDVIQGRAEPRATLLDGLRAQKLTLAAEESTQTGQPVNVHL